ncbi:MAG TPA: hypothetical protein VNM47_14350 [Terriglobia bacterium]|nr:hypothetical protein [Terriglobia bacterium]
MALIILGQEANGMDAGWYAVVTDHPVTFQFADENAVTLFAQAMRTGDRDQVIAGMDQFFINLAENDWTNDTAYEAMTVGVDSLYYNDVEILSAEALEDLGVNLGEGLDAPVALQEAAELLLAAIA